MRPLARHVPPAGRLAGGPAWPPKPTRGKKSFRSTWAVTYRYEAPRLRTRAA